jgi:hypothetical protein
LTLIDAVLLRQNDFVDVRFSLQPTQRWVLIGNFKEAYLCQ